MKSVVLLTFIFIVCISCSTFTNNTDDNHLINENRDYILINSTPYNNLLVYGSRQTPSNCSTYFQIATMEKFSRFPFHVNPGETVYIIYCTPLDSFCSGCRVIKLIGNSEKNGNDILLEQN